MEQQQTLETKAKVKSFFKAQWFPSAVASLALVISIGGHVFTAFNSVGYVESANKIEGLEAFQATTQRVDGAQDRAIQTLSAELGKLTRTVQALQAENAVLRQSQMDSKKGSKSTPSGSEAVQQQALHNAQLAKKEQHPLPNGVNERFDGLVRKRMQPFFEIAPTRSGAESLDDDDVVVLQVAVDRAGRLTDVQVASTSGQIEFDNGAVKAALRMSTIPEIGRLNDQTYSQVKVFRLSITPEQMKAPH